MNYTIAVMEEFGGMQKLYLDNSGNRYTVGLADRIATPAVYRSRTVDTLEEAERLYMRLATCFIRGEYSFEDRAKILMEG